MTTVRLTPAELRLLDIQKPAASPTPTTSLPGGKRTPPRSPRWKFGRNPPSGKPRPGHEGGAQGRPSRSRRSAPWPPALLRGTAGQALAAGLTEALAALDAVASEPFAGSAS